MKFNLKKITASALMAMVLVPGFAFAESDGNIKKDNRSGDKKTSINFCARISSVEQKIADQITRAETKQSEHQVDRIGKITKKESDVDAKRALGRGDADDKRIKNWDKMIGKTRTDAQKLAVETYKSTIANAVTVRRTSVDSAVKVYRDGLNAVLGTHNTAVSQAVAVFKTSVNAALSKAKADCASGVASQTAKETFNKSINDARKILQDTRKNAETNSGLTALKKIRNDAVALAITNFKTVTEKARADLMIALKQ
jgi:hypothetical protein